MIIVGIKVTHDGGIALIENGVLKFSVEIEKINNSHRHASVENTTLVNDVLLENGYTLDQVDHFVIDGWHGNGPFWSGPSTLTVGDGETTQELEVAQYNEKDLRENILTRFVYPRRLSINGTPFSYSSYMHVATHATSAYCTSPFAQRSQGSYILIWDGGQYPRLYYIEPAEKPHITNLGHIFTFLGCIYSIFPQYFGPYKKTTQELQHDRENKTIEGFFGGYSVAGKIMAYIALGKIRPELFDIFNQAYRATFTLSNEFEHIFSAEVRRRIRKEMYSDEDVLASFHQYLQNLLVAKLREKVQQYPTYTRNLCFSGGSALNIKWNSAIRDSDTFQEVYVPPFPNDSGSAIGAASCEYIHQTGKVFVDWSVYSGPVITINAPHADWSQKPCSLQALAQLLHSTGEPVVVVQDRAELGPRALGNRSILASPASPRMKDLLNLVKHREHYRPVAPLCLEEDAPEVFAPGTPDPYMLFEHRVHEAWLQKVPAICHLDGTARLQTVNANINPVIYVLLTEFKKLSGLPLLCNTSANLNGSGFFPDIKTVTEWGRVNYSWSNGTLYSKNTKTDFSQYR